ncbi:aspartate aminotransferase [Xylariaceae sp. FL1272]|nr:aspartate aminotransferase [Xylariaceae sp. FL1272]
MGSLDQSSSLFTSLPTLPYDEAFRTLEAFTNDSNPGKISLGAGVYRDDHGKPWTLPSVKQAIPLLPDNHDYLPQTGLLAFLTVARKLLMGDLIDEVDGRLTSIQTISGTGACHVGAAFFVNNTKPQNVWISDPSWINHAMIFEQVDSMINMKFYPYYHAKTNSFDFDGMTTMLENEAQARDIIVLQACAHNPTEQWTAIADICERKKLLPFLDTAYQGFATGDVDEDAWAIRHFAKRGTLEIGIAQSFSKNFGLYGERAGAFHVLAKDSTTKSAIQSQLVRIVRSEFSCAPAYGARIQWYEDLKTMSSRIASVRQQLYTELVRSWGHITSQTGMFSYTGLNASQVQELEKTHHIYLLSSGRASMPGLTTKNITRIAKAIDEVVRKTSKI